MRGASSDRTGERGLSTADAVGLLLVAAIVVVGVLTVAPGILDDGNPAACRALANESDRAAAAFEDWHGDNLAAVDRLATAVAENDSGGAVTEQFLRNRTEAGPFESAHVVDLSSGEITASTTGREGNVDDLPDRFGWPTEVRQVRSLTEPRVIGAYSDQTANDRLLYAAPVEDSAVLVVPVTVSTFDPGTERPGQVTYVVNASPGSELTVVYDSTGAATFQQYPYDDVVSALRSDDESLDVRSARDPEGPLQVSVANAYPDNSSERYVPAFEPVENAPFAVVVHTPRSAADGATCGPSVTGADGGESTG